jgi:hypothetical protein
VQMSEPGTSSQGGFTPAINSVGLGQELGSAQQEGQPFVLGQQVSSGA